MDNIEIHLQVIRKALRRGNAAVMVGSGFSLNAVNGTRLKGWLALARLLHGELNPGVPCPDTIGTSDILRLGEEYVQVHSQAALDDFIREHIPDDKVAPGELHQQLLDLAWSEIFTTNYDTLLERAAQKMLGRGHLTVLSRADIPHSRIVGRRRIVKLHGSLPSHRPFLFTEEDYRTYPAKFAPFVNLVRQSLLENVFCLVGFSGDDPNFLQWIGWVRDMLDKHSPPIYMFLAEQPTHGQERLLASRNIKAIVLPEAASAPGESPYAGRYRELFKLLQEKPGTAPEDWLDDNKAEGPFHYGTVDERYREFLNRITHLKDKRKTYPGWLVAPADVRYDADRILRACPTHIEEKWVLDRLSPTDPKSVVILEEYLWWMQVVLAPVYDNIAIRAYECLAGTQALAQAGDFASQDELLTAWGITDRTTFQITWLTLAATVLRWQREQVEEVGFEELAARVQAVAGLDPNWADQVTYERILLLLHKGQRQLAKSLVSQWNPGARDQYMKVRRCGLQAECGEVDEANRALTSAIQDIQNSELSDPESLWLMSREAWACLLGKHIRRTLDFLHAPGPAQAGPNIERRLVELAGKGLDPRREVETIQAELNAEARVVSEPQFIKHEFELHSTRTWYRAGGSAQMREKVLAAFKWLTLADTVAYVPRIGEVSWELDVWKQAAWWGQFADTSIRTHSILIRLFDSSMFDPNEEDEPSHKRGWFSRYQVALMRQEAADTLCDHAFETSVTLCAGPARPRVVQSEIKFYLELYSRLILRETDERKLISRVTTLLNIIAAERNARRFDIWRPLGNAYSRTLETLPGSAVTEILPLLFEIDPNPPGTSHETYEWAEWSQVVDYRIVTPLVSAHLKQKTREMLPIWFEWLKQTDRHYQEPYRTIVASRIWSRMYWANEAGLLTAEAKAELVRNLWGSNPDSPIRTGLYPWAVFHWPAPESIDRARVYKAWALAQKPHNLMNVIVGADGTKQRAIQNIAETSLDGWIRATSFIEWSDDDALTILNSVRDWWKTEWTDLEKELVAEVSRGFAFSPADATRIRVSRLDSLFARIVAPRIGHLKETQPELAAWIEEVRLAARKVEEPLWRYEFRLAESSEHAWNTLVAEWTEILIGADQYKLQKVFRNIDWYVNEYRRDGRLFESTLRTGITAMIFAVKMPQVIYALDLVRACLLNTPQALTADFIGKVDIGLQHLLEFTSYAKKPTARSIEESYIPDLRDLCAEIALAMKKQGNNLPGADAWCAAFKDDPLPELRHYHEILPK